MLACRGNCFFLQIISFCWFLKVDPDESHQPMQATDWGAEKQNLHELTWTILKNVDVITWDLLKGDLPW